MKISKTKFIEYLRCSRYSALDDVKYNQEKAFVTINGIDYNNDQYLELISNLSEDFDYKNDLGTLEIMLPYFNKVENLVAFQMENKFNSPVISSINTREQYFLSTEYNEYQFYSYVDVFQKTDESFNLCEVKAKTTNAVYNLGKVKKDEDKFDDKSIFSMCDDNIIRLKDEIGYDFKNGAISKKVYETHLAKLYDYTHDVGRLVFDLSFQRFVAEQMGHDDNANYYLGLINSQYVFDGTYVDNEPIYNTDENGNEVVCLVDLTQVTKNMQDKVRVLVEKVISYLEIGDASKVPLDKYCLRGKQRQCQYFDTCWKDIPKVNSVFSYIGSHNGFSDPNGIKYSEYDLINSGVVNLIDVDDTLIHRYQNTIQKQCVINDREFIDNKKIKAGLKTINYPIYHLDFESFPLPLPRFKGEKAYSQSVFQFSIHIEHSPGVCDKNNDHYEYLARDHSDIRQELVEKMLEYIKEDDGTILVYNQSFEKGRITEFASFFPQYKKRLDNINDRVFDLMYLIKGNKSFYEELGFGSESLFCYYHPLLSGSFSIKKVLPVFSDLTYDGMDVGNGMDAMMTYGMYNNYSREVYENKIKSLIEYCKQDTWAMVVILDKLRNM